MAHKLDVWFFDYRVGTLALVNGRLNFSYAPGWLSHKDAVAISISLPLQAPPFDDREARPFFAGLLPEGQMRRLIAQQFQVSGQNDFALLDYIGGECAGAVTFLEPGRALPVPSRSGTPSTHILKLAIRTVSDSVINEGFCMALAEAMRLKPAKSKIHQVLERSFLLVERYDRQIDAQGRWQRLHQEDFCQALGVLPEMKYQNEGGPDLARCFGLVRSAARPSAPQILRLFDYVIFNALIGNHDAHAKNFSLLYSGKTPVLAPFYDTLSTAVYPTMTPKMAMKIGSKYKFSEIEN